MNTETDKTLQALQALYDSLPLNDRQYFISENIADADEDDIVEAYDYYRDAYDDDEEDDEPIKDPRDYDDPDKCRLLADTLCAFGRSNPRLTPSLREAHRILDDAYKYMSWH